MLAGFNFMKGIVVAVVCFVIAMALTPILIDSSGMAKGRDGANCKGYVDSDATATNNQTYDSSRNTDTLTCLVIGNSTGLFVLSIVFGLVAGILGGTLGRDEPEPQQQYVSPYPSY